MRINPLSPCGLLVLLIGVMMGLPAAATPAVRIEADAPHHVQLRTGGYRLTYELGKDRHLTVRPVAELPGRLEITCAAAAPTLPLEPAAARSMRVADEAARIVVEVQSRRDWAEFTTTLECPKDRPGLLHWRVRVHTIADQALAASDYDVLFGQTDVRFKNLGGSNPAQVPLLYFYEAGLDATVLFYSDYTALNEYFKLTKTRPAYCVGTNLMTETFTAYPTQDAARKGFGYYRPPSTQIIPAGSDLVLADSYCLLQPGAPSGELAAAAQFNRALADIYPFMTKPERVYTDWLEVCEQQTRDLHKPECWTRPYDGRQHLSPYVNHSDKDATDLRTELQILEPLARFNRKFPQRADVEFERRLAENLKAFYQPTQKIIDNSIFKPGATDVMDSFYPAINAIMWGKVILAGNQDPALRSMFLNFAETIMRVGRGINYTYPWQVDWVSGKMVNQSFWQYDVGGAFAYVFLQCYQMTGEQRYLDEAKRAIESLNGHGFQLPHELDTTAAAAAACAWLYDLTHDKHYLDLSYLPVACILRRGWFWDSDYDYGRYYNMFFGLSFSKDGPQIAPLEFMGVWTMLNEYYTRLHDVLPAEYHLILPELHQWGLDLMRYFYPPLLPREAIAPGPALWPVSPKLMIALEDMNDGHTRLGTVGQGIYMSRPAPELAASTYYPLSNGGWLYADYPLLNFKSDAAATSMSFALGGQAKQQAELRLKQGRPGAELQSSVFIAENGQPVAPVAGAPSDTGETVFKAAGGTQLLIGPTRSLIRAAALQHLHQIDAPAALRSMTSSLPAASAASGEAARRAWLSWGQAVAEFLATRQQPDDQVTTRTRHEAALRELAELGSAKAAGAMLRMPVPAGMAHGDTLLVTPALSSQLPLDSPVQYAWRLPEGWQARTQGAAWELVPPATFAIGQRAEINCTAAYRVLGFALKQSAAATVECLPPVVCKFDTFGNECMTPGTPYALVLNVKNNRTRPVAGHWRITVPVNWKTTQTLEQSCSIDAGSSRTLELALQPPAGLAPGLQRIESRFTSDGQSFAHIQLVQVVNASGPLVDYGDDAALWLAPPRAGSMPVRSVNGRLQFGPLNEGFGVRERAVCIDIDRYPILSLKVDQASALWAIFADDGRHFPELGLRLQQENWRTGVYHYDLRRTGWRGVKQFRLRYVISICAPGRISEMDWLVIDSKPVEKLDPAPAP